MKYTHVFGFLFAGILASTTHSAQIVTFNFDDIDAGQSTIEVATTVANHLSVSVFSLNSGTALDNYTYTTGSPSGGNAVVESGGWGTALPTQYFSFTITPASGHTFSISQIAFEYRVTAAGAQNFQIDVGGASAVASGILTPASSWTAQPTTVTLSGLDAITEVRIYGFRDVDGSGGGAFGIDSIAIAGTVSAVPESSTVASLAGLAALSFAVLRRRYAGRHRG